MEINESGEDRSVDRRSGVERGVFFLFVVVAVAKGDISTRAVGCAKTNQKKKKKKKRREKESSVGPVMLLWWW
jgi:hypothetical protein